jgi:hypothetical protein
MAYAPLQASRGYHLIGRPLGGLAGDDEDVLTPEREQSLLGELARKTGQTIETLGLLLDTPGAIARGVLAGDPYSGFSWDNDRRVSGAELLESFGVKPTNPYIKAAAGFGTEVVTDPLFWLAGPMSALSEAGDAARAAGLLKNAPLAYMQKYGTEAAEQTARGKYITGLFDQNFVPKTPGFYQGVTPVGQRLAQANVTLEDLVKAAPNADEAIKAAVDRLGTMADYERVKGDTLGGLFGINVGRLNVPFKPPGSDTILDAMDALGAKIRFSKPGRVATGLFSQAVDGATDFGDQAFALRANALEDIYKQRGLTTATAHSLLLTKIPLSDEAKQLLGADTLYSPQGNDLLLRYAEGKATPADLQIVNSAPGFNDWYQSWDRIRQRQFAERKALGLSGGDYSDRFGTEYNPRYGDEFDFDDMEQGTGRMLYSANEAEAYGRNKALMTPGGTDDLRQISLLPEIVEYSNPASNITDEQAGKTIMDWFAANHPGEPLGKTVTRTDKDGNVILDAATRRPAEFVNQQAIAIANVMKRRSQDLPPGVPVFAAHPANTQARRIINHEVAKSRANFILEAISESAVAGARSQQQGRFRNLAESWDEIAGKAGFTAANGVAGRGAVNALKHSLAQATGQSVDQIDLGQFSIPERVVRRLQKVADFYSAPEAQQEVSGFLDGWTKLFKGFVLATPRRFVRDAYSNAISGFLETGSATRQLSGMSAASKILNGDYAGGMDALRQIPRYAGLGSDEAIKDAFIMDAGGMGVLQGLQSSELLSSARSGEMSQLIPGSTPISVASGLAELVPDGSTTLGQKLKNFTSIYGVTDAYDTQNPILRASGKIGDAVDSVGRLGTFIALMQQGVSPAEAAARVKKALVDYQSLTLTERKWMRGVFPWWAYNSRIGKYVFDSLTTRPGGAYGQMIRASNTLQETGDDVYIPENLKQRFAIRMPEELTKALGMYVPNAEQYIADIDLPGIDVANLPGQSVTDLIQNLAQQTAPPIQALMSLATGRDLFYDRPLDESVTPQDRIYNALTGSQQGLSPAVKVGVGLIPGLQVPLAIGGTLADPRLPLMSQRMLKAGINYTAGLKQATVTEQAKEADQMQKIDKELAPVQFEFTRAYIPDALEPTLTQRQREMNAVRENIAKRQRDRNKQRRAAEQAGTPNALRAPQGFRLLNPLTP